MYGIVVDDADGFYLQVRPGQGLQSLRKADIIPDLFAKVPPFRC